VSKKKIVKATIKRKTKENFCLAPFFKRADRIAIPKSSLLEDIFFFVH
tara:strand:+ start:18 stop:161 length:144 start_codon:yes stop_codon:yes gene_type:complete